MPTPTLTRSSTAELVYAQLIELGAPGLRPQDIQPDSLLVDELGLDSLKFVELTVGLEHALGIPEFPMQDWVDQRIRYGQPLTVGSLVSACDAIVQSLAREAR